MTDLRFKDPNAAQPHRRAPETVLTDRTMEERPYRPREAKLQRRRLQQQRRRKEAFPESAVEGRGRGCAGAVGASFG